MTNFLFWGQRSFYLDQSRVPAVVQILKNALFPITCKRPSSPLGAWGTLTSRRTCIALLSSLTRGALWSLGARGTLTSRGTCITLASEWACWTSWPCTSLGAWKSLFSTGSFIAFDSSWTHRSFGSVIPGWSRCTRWSRGSRASWDTRYARCAETRRVTTRAMLGILLRKLRAEMIKRDECIIHSLWFGVNALLGDVCFLNGLWRISN